MIQVWDREARESLRSKTVDRRARRRQPAGAVSPRPPDESSTRGLCSTTLHYKSRMSSGTGGTIVVPATGRRPRRLTRRARGKPIHRRLVRVGSHTAAPETRDGEDLGRVLSRPCRPLHCPIQRPPAAVTGPAGIFFLFRVLARTRQVHSPLGCRRSAEYHDVSAAVRLAGGGPIPRPTPTPTPGAGRGCAAWRNRRSTRG